MSAPAGQCNQVRRKWSARLARIDSQIVHAYVHRHLWESVREQIIEVNPDADGQFLGSYTTLYAESVMMMIRRLADTDDNSGSMWRLWDSIKRNPHCATRALYIEHAVAQVDEVDRETVRQQSDLHFTKWLGDGDHVDPDQLTDYQNRLIEDGRRVREFVDKRIAHLDHRAIRPASLAIHLREVHETMDRVSWHANQLHRLLDRRWMMHSLVAVPPTWQASLRGLFPPPPGVDR